MLTARTFIINGQKYDAAIEDGETLLDVLRDKLRLTGTKKGCDSGDCGEDGRFDQLRRGGEFRFFRHICIIHFVFSFD